MKLSTRKTLPTIIMVAITLIVLCMPLSPPKALSLARSASTTLLGPFFRP